MAREYTNHLLELVDEGLLDKDRVILACVKYMSEADVKDMMEYNDLLDMETFNFHQQRK
jgi:hypothetical protein